MKILYVVPSLANKGPVIVAKNLVEVMVSHGHECMVGYFDEIKEIPFPCTTERIKSKKYDFSSFDIVHSHGLRPDLFVYRNRKRKGNAKLISTLHNYVYQDLMYEYNPFYALVFGSLWMLIVRGFDRIAVLSEDAKKYYSRFLPKYKLRVAYNTRMIYEDDIDVSDRTILTGFKDNCNIIGVNALLTKRKGIDMLIKALPKMSGWKLVVIGDGKEIGNLKKIALGYNVDDRVLFLGYRKDAYRYLPYYDIFAIPSRSEGFPLSLLEAAIYHRKVVASDIPIFKELFDGSEVSFFELENIDSLVTAITTATKYNNIGNRLYDKYLNMYSPDSFYSNYISIYNE